MICGHYRKREVVKEFAIIGGLIGVQFVYAGNSVVLSYLMSLGLSPPSLIISSTFATFLVLSPLAFFFERHTWPKRFKPKLFTQLVVISFAGVTLFQSLMLKGIMLTSPAMATAMPNLAPGLIFIIAWACRLEKVELSCIYSRVKIVGTLLCVIGAVTMSVLQSTRKTPIAKEMDGQTSPSAHYYTFDKDRFIGCICLIGAVIVLSSNVVLQAITLGDLPAPISLCAITSLIGVILTGLLELIQHQGIITVWPVWNLKELICYALLSGSIGGACVSFNGWAMKKRGPVMVSMFNPVGTVISVIMSGVIGEYVGIGSITGMLVMFTGLYFVLWAKEKERYFNRDENGLESEYHDAEKPLLT